MSLAQYRCLCAHMRFWMFGLDNAIADCGITISREEVISELDKAGWKYDDSKDTLECEI